MSTVLKKFEKGRKFCSTLHNYTPEQEAAIHSWKAISFAVYGREICPDTGTPHLQIYLEFKSPTTIAVWHNLVKVKANTTVPVGDAEANIKYCTKDGDFDTWGIPPNTKKPGKRNDFVRMRSAVASGKSLEEICDVCTSYQSLRSAEILMKYKEVPRPKNCVTVISVQGIDEAYSKSSADEIYVPITLDNWDGYDGHLEVYIDLACDMDMRMYQKYRKYLGQFPFRVNTKGGSRHAQYRTLYVSGIHGSDTRVSRLLSQHVTTCDNMSPDIYKYLYDNM